MGRSATEHDDMVGRVDSACAVCGLVFVLFEIAQCGDLGKQHCETKGIPTDNSVGVCKAL